MKDDKSVDTPQINDSAKLDVSIGVMGVNTKLKAQVDGGVVSKNATTKRPKNDFIVPHELTASLTENFFKLMRLGSDFANRNSPVLLKQEKDNLKKELGCGDKEAEAAFLFINPNPRGGTALATKELVCQFPILISAWKDIAQHNQAPTSSNLKTYLLAQGYSEQTSKNISYLLLSKNKQK